MSPVAVVLGAGGAAGHAFHVGVLSALADEFGWDARAADLLIGTSAGAAVAAALRVGLHPLDMRARETGDVLSAEGAELVRVGETAIAAAHAADDLAAEESAAALADRVRRIRLASPERIKQAVKAPRRVTPGSLISALVPEGRHSNRYLGAPYDELVGEHWPAGDTWLVAVELDTGERVVFGRERRGAPTARLAQAVEASCAVPGYFAPAEIDGVRYVDGGVHSTTNADLAGAMSGSGRRLVIVSAPMSAHAPTLQISARSAVRQFARRTLESEAAALRALEFDVVTFQPSPEVRAAMGGAAGATLEGETAATIVEVTVDAVRAALADPVTAESLAPLRA